VPDIELLRAHVRFPQGPRDRPPRRAQQGRREVAAEGREADTAALGRDVALTPPPSPSPA